MDDKIRKTAMYRRWAYMAVAILAILLMKSGPAFSFADDKGIIYVRSFSMDMEQLEVTQTELATGVGHTTAVMSVKGLYYCYWAMLIGSIAALLSVMGKRWRLRFCVFTIIAAGVYYILLIYYAMQISEDFFATLLPTWTVFLPAVVLEMMVLTLRNIRNYGHYLDEENANEEVNEEG